MKNLNLRSGRLSLNEALMMSVMIAVQIILRRFTIGTSFFQVNLLFIIIFLMGKWFSAWWAATGCGISDVLGTLLNGGMYIPGFTLSAALTGLIEGCFFHRRPVSWPRVIISQLLIVVLVDGFLNTGWLALTYGINFKLALLMRWPKEVIVMPIQIIVIYLLGNNRGIKSITERFFN